MSIIITVRENVSKVTVKASKGIADMTKQVYDTNDNGIVDNAEMVNGFTVETAVPINAVFTDTTYNEAPLAARTTKLENDTSNIDNTSDLDKPISTATANALGEIIQLENLIVCTQLNKGTTLGGVIDSTKEYFIDGTIDLGATSIEIPIGGMHIKGYDFNISGLTSSQASYTMFTSPVGGSGDVLWSNFKIEVTGANSQVLDIVSDDGGKAFEIDKINFNNCTSLGEIDNYRQGLESGTGRFGGTPNLILSGAWSGGYFVETSIARGLTDGSYALYEKGTGFVMGSRFRSNANVDLNATVAFFDFDEANFTNPSTVQLDGCIATRNGAIDSGDSTITPNITQSSVFSAWRGNVGIPNTFVGGALNLTTEVTTVISGAGIYVDLAGTVTSSDLQHFDSPANGQLRHLGDSPREFKVIYSGILACTSGDEIDLKLVVWDNSASGFVDYKNTRRVVNNLQGARDVAFFTVISKITLDKNDYVKLQVANVGNTNNITAELDSDFAVEER
jgi:hypothetical protein